MADNDKCPTGPGGNRQIVNHDEAQILARTLQTPVRVEGQQDKDKH